MKTIVVKNQAEFDAAKTEKGAIIELRSDADIWIHVQGVDSSSRVEAWGSSSVVAWGSSRVEAWGSSRVEARDSSSVVAWGSSSVVAWGSSSVVAWGSSRVEARGSSSVVARDSSRVVAYEFTTLVVFSAFVLIKHLADKAICRLRGVTPKIERQDKTAKVLKEPKRLDISFEIWLERGWVIADGVRQKLISRKKQGGLEIFTVEKSFLDNSKAYVVKRGNQFSHGDTVKKAIADLRFKLADRDTTRFKKWKLDTVITQDDGIQAYRAITGACEFGVKSFISGKRIPKKLAVSKVIEITKDQYGSRKFSEFFGGKQ